MLNSLNQQSGENASDAETKKQSHTFIIRLTPKYLSYKNEQKWHGEFQYVLEGEEVVEKKFNDAKHMIKEFVKKIKEIIVS